MNLSEPFIRRPVMTAVSTASVIVFGVLSYTRLPVNDLPAVDYPVIQVQADYPGASPETVANNIATPLERRFMQINGLEVVTSKSTQGHTSLTLEFALDKSIDAAATDVQTAISQATSSLPADLPSQPTFSKNSGSISRTRATIRPMTSAASCGVSPAAAMRRSRCSVMPDTVWTIEVNAPSGMT